MYFLNKIFSVNKRTKVLTGRERLNNVFFLPELNCPNKYKEAGESEVHIFPPVATLIQRGWVGLNAEDISFECIQLCN